MEQKEVMSFRHFFHLIEDTFRYHCVTTFNLYFDIIAFLENILKKKVDMVEQSYINKHIKKAILSDKIDII